MKTCDRESYQLRELYQGAMPDVLAAGEQLHIAMGVEREAFDDNGQLVVLPWHMPLPRELQRRLQPKSHQLSTAIDTVNSGHEMSLMPCKGAGIGALPQRNKRRTDPSNQLERALHKKSLAQHLSAPNIALPVPLRSKDANLPLLLARTKAPIKTNEVLDNVLKRKLSKVKLPVAPEDGPLSGEVPNLSNQPAFQHRFRNSEPSPSTVQDTVGVQKKPGHPKTVEHEEKSESPSPPRRRSMPPIEAVLAHGFKNLNLVRLLQDSTPRSHAFEPWTNLALCHKVVSPTPAFLLNMTPFQYDDSEDTYYWKSSLPMLLSYHFANPAALIQETPIQRLTFDLPAPTPKLSLASVGNRKQPNRASRQPHYKTEGPETNTEVRLIRIILPPLLHGNKLSDKEVPFTDWLIICLSDSTSTAPPANTRVLRSTTKANKYPYLMLAIPTHAIAETAFVSKSPIATAVGEDKKQQAITTMLRFTSRGRLPLMFGVGRDASFADKWVKGFGMGVASLEVTVKGGESPCWM
ncbi:unnamed protein product [Aureobasidium vineae]|uniref:Uncharacterized protein n=1 Tax=Aureobasidium vineae TaxID=2773715 RepID=A0A9N8J8N2_9PEZI|nr:unnamed protein product [Aureobasidium vineae]